MKVVVLGTRGFPNIQGGVETHCAELYPRLVAAGCDVTVIGRAPYTGKAPYEYEGVKIIPLACPKNKFLEAVWHTFCGVLKARQIGCDVLHIHAIGPALFVPLARLLGMKVVMTHHGPDYDRKKWNAVAKGVLKLGERLGVKFANHVITVSKAIAAMVYQKYGREVTAIPNGVVIFPRAAGRHVLSRHNVEQNKYILAVGRFVPEKGFDELLQSFQQFSAKNQDGWKLVIAGDADHDDDFSRKLKQDCRNTSDVVLTGFIKGRELRELYSHAALFVLPSYHEGLPIVLLEALSYGASCLVSDIPANREVCLEKDRYFKPGDIPTMTRKLHQYLDNFSEDSMDRQGMINYIRETYNWDLIAEQTLGLYQQSSSFSTAEKAETYPA